MRTKRGRYHEKDIDDAKKQRIRYEEATASYIQKQEKAELLDTELKEKTRIYFEAQAGADQAPSVNF